MDVFIRDMALWAKIITEGALQESGINKQMSKYYFYEEISLMERDHQLEQSRISLIHYYLFGGLVSIL